MELPLPGWVSLAPNRRPAERNGGGSQGVGSTRQAPPPITASVSRRRSVQKKDGSDRISARGATELTPPGTLEALAGNTVVRKVPPFRRTLDGRGGRRDSHGDRRPRRAAPDQGVYYATLRPRTFEAPIASTPGQVAPASFRRSVGTLHASRRGHRAAVDDVLRAGDGSCAR